jgi:hypothetical protein
VVEESAAGLFSRRGLESLIGEPFKIAPPKISMYLGMVRGSLGLLLQYFQDDTGWCSFYEIISHMVVDSEKVSFVIACLACLWFLG